MCNATQDQMQMLEKTVRQFLEQGRLFTGYDVTIETREREGVQMRHRDVRGAVHEIECLQDALDYGWDDPSGQPVQWAKTQVSMPGGQWAFVYHPANVDPNTYQPRQTTNQATSPPSAPPSTAPTGPAIAPATVADSGGDNGDGTFSPDYRNRLFVPTKFLRDAGLNPGDECYVVSDSQNKLILLAGDSTNFNGGTVRVTTQRVERNGDLRLSSTTLKSAELDADKFVIENTDQDGTAVVKIAASN